MVQVRHFLSMAECHKHPCSGVLPSRQRVWICSRMLHVPITNRGPQALKDMDTDTLRRILGDVNLPSWVNFPGEHVQNLSMEHI